VIKNWYQIRLVCGQKGQSIFSSMPIGYTKKNYILNVRLHKVLEERKVIIFVRRRDVRDYMLLDFVSSKFMMFIHVQFILLLLYSFFFILRFTLFVGEFSLTTVHLDLYLYQFFSLLYCIILL